MICYNCGKQGHRAADCWGKKKDGSKGLKDGKRMKGPSKAKAQAMQERKRNNQEKHAWALDGAGEEEDAAYEAGDEPENEDVTLLRSMVSP